MAHGSTPKCLQSDHALKIGFWLFCNQQTIQPNESLQPIQQIKNMNNVLMSVLLASTPTVFWWNEQREWLERMLPSNDMWREHWGDMTKGSKNFHGDDCDVQIKQLYIFVHMSSWIMICFDNLVDFFPNKMTPDILTPLSLDLPFLQQHIHVCCSLWPCMPAENLSFWLKLTRHLIPLIEGWAAHQSRSSDVGTIWC